jgi:hypothetical protein
MRFTPIILVLCCAASAAAQGDRRLPVPAKSDLEAAQKVVEEVYSKDYKAAKSATQKRSLVRRLQDDALKTRNDPVSKFALQQVARNMAIAAGDPDLALQMGESIAAGFQVDPLAQRVEIMEGIVPLVKTSPEHTAFLPYLQRTIDRLAKANRLAEAREMAGVAMASAKKVGDGDLIKQWTRRSNELEAQAKLSEAYKAAKKTLESAPTDGAANDTVGKFLCMMLGDWEQGLTYLALGADAQLQPLAERELKREADKIALGEGWTKAAEGLPEDLQAGALRRAEKHFQTALPAASGIEQRKLEKRIEELQPRTSAFHKDEWVDLLDYVDPARHAFNAGLMRDGDAIIIEEHHENGGFTIPVTATSGYEIRMVAVGLTDKVQGPALRLPGTSGALYALNAHSGTASGLALIDGKPCDTNASRTPGVPIAALEPFVLQIRYEPRGDLVAISTTLNGRKYSRWAGALKSLSMTSTLSWKPNQFGVSAWESRFAVKSFEIKVLDGAAYVTE